MFLRILSVAQSELCLHRPKRISFIETGPHCVTRSCKWQALKLTNREVKQSLFDPTESLLNGLNSNAHQYRLDICLWSALKPFSIKKSGVKNVSNEQEDKREHNLVQQWFGDKTISVLTSENFKLTFAIISPSFWLFIARLSSSQEAGSSWAPFSDLSVPLNCFASTSARAPQMSINQRCVLFPKDKLKTQHMTKGKRHEKSFRLCTQHYNITLIIGKKTGQIGLNSIKRDPGKLVPEQIKSGLLLLVLRGLLFLHVPPHLSGQRMYEDAAQLLAGQEIDPHTKRQHWGQGANCSPGTQSTTC